MIPSGRAVPASVLPVLLGAEHNNLISAEAALDGSLNVLQRASQTAAGEALNALALRFSAGNDRLAELVRKDQDLAGEAGKLDKSIIAAVSAEPSRRDAAKERRIRDRIAAIGKERDDLQAVVMRDFPDGSMGASPVSRLTAPEATSAGSSCLEFYCRIAGAQRRLLNRVAADAFNEAGLPRFRGLP